MFNWFKNEKIENEVAGHHPELYRLFQEINISTALQQKLTAQIPERKGEDAFDFQTVDGLDQLIKKIEVYRYDLERIKQAAEKQPSVTNNTEPSEISPLLDDLLESEQQKAADKFVAEQTPLHISQVQEEIFKYEEEIEELEQLTDYLRKKKRAAIEAKKIHETSQGKPQDSDLN